MTADGKFTSIEECASAFCHIKESIEPDVELAKRYEKKYQTFRSIYPALKNIFKQL